MPQKKTKKIVDESMWVVLYDEKNSSHHIVARDKLTFAKKDNLRIGTPASYNGDGDRANRVRGKVIVVATKELCENSIKMIEETNNNNDDNNEQDESDESDESDQFHIDEKDENDIDERLLEEEDLPTTSGTDDRILIDITNIPVEINKRKEPNEQSTSSTKRVKRASTVSHSSYEKVQRENNRLNKDLTMYKNTWMPRPSGAVAAYFIEIARILSGTSNDNDDNEEEKGEKLEKICTTLDRNESELKLCEHDMNITKTCRQLIKCLYPDTKQRAKMLVSSMDVDKLQAIHDYARIVHPAQSKTSNSVLNNAIGNVFASEKRKQERHDMEIFRLNNYSEDDEDNEQ
ncbi:unnamed protein product [Adineta steineri]|uniref:BEN domain-containing protein n=1 Tax=Adineta steineri TaxID=433720 RepID=A0A814ZDY6_9BILA|nr:unnamed protein product [Adineta steineri]CAF1528971.1 unnamed protein product [Adineta steineri]